jgi:hypothetical protein
MSYPGKRSAGFCPFAIARPYIAIGVLTYAIASESAWLRTDPSSNWIEWRARTRRLLLTARRLESTFAIGRASPTIAAATTSPFNREIDQPVVGDAL